MKSQAEVFTISGAASHFGYEFRTLVTSHLPFSNHTVHGDISEHCATRK